MNKYHLLTLVCFILGIVFFALGVLYGDVETGFIVVFPFLSGTGIFAFFYHFTNTASNVTTLT